MRSQIMFYCDYLLIQELDALTNTAVVKEFVWDPSESVATRPLAISIVGAGTFFCTHDLTKNVCELIDTNLEIAQTYDYAPFGTVEIGIPSGSSTIANPFQFSSEVHDSELALVYYNYRNYNPADGRWLTRDPIAEQGGLNLYAFARNSNISLIDSLGRLDTDAVVIKSNVYSLISPLFSYVGNIVSEKQSDASILAKANAKEKVSYTFDIKTAGVNLSVFPTKFGGCVRVVADGCCANVSIGSVISISGNGGGILTGSGEWGFVWKKREEIKFFIGTGDEDAYF